jgi:hypothetical protein
MLPRHPRHEGNYGILVRESGEELEVPFHKYRALDTIDLSEVELPTLSEAFDKYRDLASKTDEQVSEDVEELKDTTAESLGNVVELGVRPLVQAVIEGVEKIPLLADPQSVDELFDLYQVRYMLKDAPAQDIEAAREQMKNGPYKEQAQRLLERKREERRVRESSRQLVG